MQIPCPYILSRFIRVMLCHTSKFRSIWCNLIYRGTPPEMDRVYRNISQGLSNYSNSSTVGFEPQTYCMRSGNLTTILRSPDLNISNLFFYMYLLVCKLLYSKFCFIL